MTYSMNVRLFERAIKQYDRKAAAMRKMCSRTRIQETVAPNYQYILYNKDSALEMMLAVKNQFKPTIVREWNGMMGIQKHTVDIAIWLSKVENKYNEARIFEVAEITLDGATYSFLETRYSRTSCGNSFLCILVADEELDTRSSNSQPYEMEK